MVGAVGKDEYEPAFMEELAKYGIDNSGIKVVEGMPTSTSFVIVEEDSRNNRILCFVGAMKAWQVLDFNILHDLCGDIRPDLVIAVTEVNTSTIEQVILTAGREGTDFLLNATPASNILKECYKHLTHLLINESEATILSGLELKNLHKDKWSTITKIFLKLGVKNVVNTLGEARAYHANNQVSGHFPAYDINPVDSTGAGDTFTGTYASECVWQVRAGEQQDIEKAVQRACMASALDIGKTGAQEGIPWANEIAIFATEHDTKRVPAGIAILNEEREAE